VSLGEFFPTFRRMVLPSSSGLLDPEGKVFGSLETSELLISLQGVTSRKTRIFNVTAVERHVYVCTDVCLYVCRCIYMYSVVCILLSCKSTNSLLGVFVPHTLVLV